MNMKVVVGIDIAKNSFNVCVSGCSGTYHFDNSAKDLKSCQFWIVEVLADAGIYEAGDLIFVQCYTWLYFRLCASTRK